MAENDSSQEKTEEPTARRLEKGKEDGQIPRSKELSTSLVLIAGSLSIWVFGRQLYASAEHMFDFNFAIEREALFDSKQLVIHLSASAVDAVLHSLPIFIVLFIAAIVGPLALGGWMFSAKSLAPKPDRLNPISGLKRMFGLKSLVELAKSWAKVLVLFSCSLLLFFFMEEQFMGLHREPSQAAIAHSVDLVIKGFVALALSTLLISIIDVPFQIYDFTKKMKMSLQEVKDEHKDTEGKPEVKQRIRRLQYEMAQKRMMQDVPDADVVITNPTHYAVALKYESSAMEAPTLVAKGIDEMALKIKEIALDSKVPLVQAPSLARSVYTHTAVGKEIPEGLYVAIAQVLAYVFQLDQFMKGIGPKPKQPSFPIPEDLRA